MFYPETNEPFLKPVRVELLREADDEAITLPSYLRDAYQEAEEFCSLLGHRVMGSVLQLQKNIVM